MQSIRTDDEAAGQIGDIYVGHDAIRITQTLCDDVAWNGRLRLFRLHLPGIDGFLTLRMVSRDADQRSGVPHGNDIRGGSIGMRQRTEMVGAGIANIDHIGLVREVLIIGVTEQSSAAGAGGIRMILGAVPNRSRSCRPRRQGGLPDQECRAGPVPRCRRYPDGCVKAWRPIVRNAGQPTGLPARRLCRRPLPSQTMNTPCCANPVSWLFLRLRPTSLVIAIRMEPVVMTPSPSYACA